MKESKRKLKCEFFDFSLESMKIFNIITQEDLLDRSWKGKNMLQEKKELYLFEENQKENHNKQ